MWKTITKFLGNRQKVIIQIIRSKGQIRNRARCDPCVTCIENWTMQNLPLDTLHIEEQNVTDKHVYNLLMLQAQQYCCHNTGPPVHRAQKGNLSFA